MKITKRQLRRLIREMHPRAGVDDAIFDYEEWARERGSPPSASSVIASYFVSKGSWSAPDMRVLGDQYGIALEDIQREVSMQRKEMAAGGLSQEVPEASPGSRPGEHKLDFGKDIGTYNYRNEGTKMKITKRQLRRIIKEASSDDWENRRNRWAKFKHHMAREPQLYLDWVEKNGHVTSAASSVMATYFLEMGLENEHKIHKKLASEIGLDHKDVMREMGSQKNEQKARLGESKVKITKRQLRRIIREEKKRILEETGSRRMGFMDPDLNADLLDDTRSSKVDEFSDTRDNLLGLIELMNQAERRFVIDGLIDDLMGLKDI